MVGNPEKCNHNLYYQYHQDHGHTTENCRSLWDYLDQLVREGKSKQLLNHSNGLGSQANSGSQRDILSRPPLGTINVIFAAPGRTRSCPSRIIFIARLSSGDTNQDPKRARVELSLVMGFSNEDKIGTIQPHDDALVITLQIGGYEVKRVMVDQGSAAEIMYPDLYKGLNLKAKDLTPYSSPLMSFKRKIIIPKGQVKLLVQTSLEVVEVDFIVVDIYSPYTAIVARPWLHTLKAVSSTLHQKVKYLSEGQIKEILGDQSLARQCMVAAIQHKPEAESSVHGEKGL